MKKAVGFIVAVLFLFPACDQQVDPLSKLQIPPDGQMLRDCHDQKMWSAQSLRAALVGEWRWYYSANDFSGSFYPPRNTLDLNTVVVFGADTSYNVMEAGEVTHTTQWSLEEVQPGFFNADTETFKSPSLGFVILCDDLVEFSESYIDGDDNYFVRID